MTTLQASQELTAWAEKHVGSEPATETIETDNTKSALADLLRGFSDKPTDPNIRDYWLFYHPRTVWGLGKWRRYELGHWPIVSQDMVCQEIGAAAETFVSRGIRPTSGRIRSVREMAEWQTFVKLDRWDADTDILVCGNGTLHLPTRTIREHNPENYCTGGVSYDYDEAATCPTFQRVLQETTNDDIAVFLQEFAGYSLTTDTSLETAVWLYGPAGGGKSTIIHGFKTMLGSRCGALSLRNIERSRFSVATIVGKTLLVAAEQPGGYIESTDLLKNIISGDHEIQVEQKYRDPIEIRSTAKLLWAMNTLPRIANAEDGIFRRVHVIEIPGIPTAEQDPTLKRQIAAEAPGILNWAIEGLARLQARGRFFVPEEVERASERFQLQNDKAQMFVSDRCVTGVKYQVRSMELYREYKDWCESSGHRPQSTTAMAREWKRLGFEGARTMHGKTWYGVGLLSESLDDKLL